MLGTLGAVGGGLLGRLGDVMDAPRRALWGGATSLYNAVTGDDAEAPENGADLLSRMGMDSESPLTKALGMAADVAGDPLTYAGGLLGKLGGRLAGGAGKTEAMLGGRRTFPMVKNIGDGAVPRVVGNAEAAIGGRAGLEQMTDLVGNGVKSQAEQGVKYLGAYSPDARAGFLTAGSGPQVARHETIHGLNHGVASGIIDPAGMPLPIRATGSMLSSDSPLLRQLGEIADETTAHGMMHKGVGRQLLGASDFLMDPTETYARQFATRGVRPSLVSLYKNAPYLAAGAGAAATAIPAYMAMRD